MHFVHDVKWCTQKLFAFIPISTIFDRILIYTWWEMKRTRLSTGMGEVCAKVLRNLVQIMTSSDICGAGGAHERWMISQVPFITTSTIFDRILIYTWWEMKRTHLSTGIGEVYDLYEEEEEEEGNSE